MSLELPYGIKVLDNTPLDSLYGPYADVAAAKAAIPQAIRYDGLTVQITGTGEYHWLAADLSDTGLVAKGGGSALTNGNGTTANGSAADLGGTQTASISIEPDTADTYNLTFGSATNRILGMYINMAYNGSFWLQSGPQSGFTGANSNILVNNDLIQFYTFDRSSSITTSFVEVSSTHLDVQISEVSKLLVTGTDVDISNTLRLIQAPSNDDALTQVLVRDGVSGEVKYRASSSLGGGSGNVTKVGTPADNQVGVWTGDGTIEGTSGLTYNGSNFQLTGDIGSTGTRITKGWFVDLQVTNAIAGSITGNAATVTTNANLTGHITSTGNAAVLGSFTLAQLNTAVSDANMASLAGSETLTNKTIDFTDNTIVMSKAELTAAVSDDDVLFAGDVGAGLTISSGSLIANNTIYDPTITANAYTLVASDNKKILHIDNGATAVTVNLPNSLLTGFSCTIVNKGTGILTLAAAGTLEADATTIQTQNTGATVYHEGSNVWTAVGSLGTPLVQEKTIAFVVGEATAITTGGKNFTRVISPYTGTIKRWYLIADQSTTTTVDIWKSAGAIPTNTNTITASAKPALSAAELNDSSTLTGWTTSVAEGDVLIMEVESNNNATYLNLQLVIEL